MATKKNTTWRGLGLDFADGRKVQLLLDKGQYILRFTNPTNAPEQDSIFSLSPEAMSALINLYAYGFCDVASDDYKKFLANLTEEGRKKIAEIEGDAKVLLQKADGVNNDEKKNVSNIRRNECIRRRKRR